MARIFSYSLACVYMRDAARRCAVQHGLLSKIGARHKGEFFLDIQHLSGVSRADKQLPSNRTHGIERNWRFYVPYVVRYNSWQATPRQCELSQAGGFPASTVRLHGLAVPFMAASGIVTKQTRIPRNRMIFIGVECFRTPAFSQAANDEAVNVIETHEHKGQFREVMPCVQRA
jgi:hypothetical protein